MGTTLQCDRYAKRAAKARDMRITMREFFAECDAERAELSVYDEGFDEADLLWQDHLLELDHERFMDNYDPRLSYYDDRDDYEPDYNYDLDWDIAHGYV